MSPDSILPVLAQKIFGAPARRVVLYLLKKGEATVEEMVRDLHMDENELRKLLNMLYENSLVKYRRVRGQGDKLYKYLWRPTDEPPMAILESRKRKVVKLLDRALRSTERESYVCPNCGRYYSFDEAADALFRCLECDAILEPAETGSKAEKIREIIQVVESACFTTELAESLE